MQFLCAPQVLPSPSLQHCCQEMLSAGVTATVLCFSFLPPLPVSWFPCKRRHSQWGTVAHTAGLGPRVFHVRHHRVSQNTPHSYSREMLWALGCDTRHCSGQPGTREADPALGTESQAENTREQSRQSEIETHWNSCAMALLLGLTIMWSDHFGKPQMHWKNSSNKW